MKKTIFAFLLIFISFSGFSIGRQHNTFATHKAIVERSKTAKLQLPNLKSVTDLKTNNSEDKGNNSNFSEKLSVVQRIAGMVLRLVSR